LAAFAAANEGATIAPEAATARTRAVARLRLRRIIVCLSNFFRGMINPLGIGQSLLAVLTAF